MPTSRTRAPRTPERLTEAAIALFSRKWYGTVSVAEVCREAGLSNGVFYRYFDSKETLFKAILGQVLDRVKAALEPPPTGSRQARLEELAVRLFRFSAEHPDLVAVFREGQYRFFEFERRLEALYRRSLGEVLGREPSAAEYLFMFGGLRFTAIRSASNEAPVRLDTVRGILEDGLYRGLAADPGKVFGGSATPLPLPLNEGARERLLRAGRRLFGEQGYFESNIHEITTAAGASVGSFYTWFASKEAFYAEVIIQVGHDVRAFIARNLAAAGPLNALEYELRGLWLWLVHLSIDRHCYNIVREAEFILPAAVRAYYRAFEDGYRARPDHLRATCAAPGLDEATAVEYLMGVAHYLGLEAAFDSAPLDARALVEGLGVLLAGGLAPESSEHP